ncbi:helix-turn-helix transcriptional regulator [Rhodoferax saidenbachensis]|uniref:Transcriptional regulator with XRE-family HTH domain n=1 Tax=Rhodoferax saidenbachensis TaxID=1484693 RepID=A0ABU1ZSZ9_9BURK|nr:helix-turn-helix transcriptional regulator [Rhodoferax saidenbachensis]MDR7308668.1 transcriptional regulator with XRE-family HTH domain [Rhodoferax saidenbachensis]
MELRHAFAKALRKARKANGLTQEDFADVSSRTYLSTLERGQKSPTLDKVHVLAQTIGIHVLSLMTLTYLCSKKESNIDLIFEKIRTEIDGLNQDKG